MKRIGGFFIALILSAATFSVVAQDEQNSQNALRDVVERSTYGDNWFVSLNGNANMMAGEQDGLVPLIEKLKYGGAFTIGKWFNPNFGARIQVTGGYLRGWNFTATPFDGYYNIPGGLPHVYGGYPIGGDFKTNPDYKLYTNKVGQEGFWQEFTYGSATFDIMANLTNLFRGRYVEHNRFDVIPFVGLGVIHAFNNKLTTPKYSFFAVKVGVRLNFNITDNWAIFLEPQATATEREFDGYGGTALGDGVANLGLGIQYTFNKRYNTLSNIVQLTADEIDKLNRKVNDNRYLIDNQQAILEKQQNLLERLQKCCDENRTPVTTTIVQNTGWMPEYVRFALDSYKIESSEQHKIFEVADYLKRNENSKILLIGYADRKTGNPPYNMKLSQRRVDAVAAELKRLGVNPNRIISEWRGDKEQPFPENEWNRVVVMVEKK